VFDDTEISSRLKLNLYAAGMQADTGQGCGQDATRSTACGCALISSQGRDPPLATNTATLAIPCSMGFWWMGRHPTGTTIAFSALQCTCQKLHCIALHKTAAMGKHVKCGGSSNINKHL